MTIGEIQRWGPTEDGTPAWNRDDLDSSEADRDPLPIPGAVPYWDLNFGLKFHFNDKASLRLEGGWRSPAQILLGPVLDSWRMRFGR